MIRADGVARWAIAVANVLHAHHDPKTLEAWSAIRGVAPETLRGWLRTARLSPKHSLDLARVLRALYQSRQARTPSDRFLDVADRRTLQRLLVEGGLTGDAPASTLREVLARQTFIRDRIALKELRRVLDDLGYERDA
jgi:hypothetical protein